MSNEQPAQTTPDEVAQFLSGKAPEAVAVPIDPAVLGEILPEKEAEEKKERVVVPLDPVNDPRTPTQANVLRWTLEAENIGNITVTDDEKKLYLKAMLNDTPVIWDIAIEALGVTVRMQSANNFELDVLFRALREDEDAGLIRTPSDWATYLQQYAAAFQVCAFNSSPFERLALKEPYPTSKEAITALRSHRDKYLMPMNHARWQAILRAVRIFEIKKKLCTEAAINGDFWKPVS